MIRLVRPFSIVVVGIVLSTACSSAQPVTATRSSNDVASTTQAPEPTPSPTDAATTVVDPAASPAPSSTAPPEPTPSAGSIEWESLSSGSDIELATLNVPVDYDDPSGPQFELALARRPANDQANKIGSLLVNPGGPGFGGTELVYSAEAIYGRDLLDRFDIVGWDPRGTGDSTPAIDCIDDYDYYYAEIDSTPDDDDENQHLIDVAKEFATNCVDNNTDIVDRVGTNNSARDINAIREALGEDQISYFGFSYGSELGATWATLFPDTVRAAVLDGAADPTADSYTALLQQLKGFQASVNTFLSRCDDAGCTFETNGDAAAAFEQLMEDLDANPVPSDPGRPPVNRDVAINGTILAMYDERFWPQLDQALADAQQGDGSGLLALHDTYFQRIGDGQWGNQLEAFQVISCNDTDERPTIEEVAKDNEGLHEAAPLLVPEDSAGGYFCSFFPPAADPRVDITGAGAGPIVVVGTTGDPATPLDSSRRMAETLEDGRLIVVDAEQHTGYGVNSCVDDLVESYLLDLAAPDDGVEC